MSWSASSASTRGRWSTPSPARPPCIDVGEYTGNSARLEEARRIHGFAGSAGLQVNYCHHRLRIGEDGAEKLMATDLVQTATGERAIAWSTVVADITSDFEVTDLTGVGLSRQIPVSEDLTVVEFDVEPPLLRGDRLHSHHEFTLRRQGDVSDGVCYVLQRTAQLLVLSATFDGDLPREIHSQRWLPTADGPEDFERPRISGHDVQLVVPDPEAGSYGLTWSW